MPDGAVARLYLEGVDPEAYRLLDRQLLREVAGAALDLRLEPQFHGRQRPRRAPPGGDPGRPMGLLPDPPGPHRARPRAASGTWATATSKKPSSRRASTRSSPARC